jgi:phosphoribosylamine-glycine ligase
MARKRKYSTSPLTITQKRRAGIKMLKPSHRKAISEGLKKFHKGFTKKLHTDPRTGARYMYMRNPKTGEVRR